MQSQQLIHRMGFTPNEKKLNSLLNRKEALADQAELCGDKCLANGIGLQRDENGRVLPFNQVIKDEMSAEELFSDKEMECIENCIIKFFITGPTLLSEVSTLMARQELTEHSIKERLNNPSKRNGPYFFARDPSKTVAGGQRL